MDVNSNKDSNPGSLDSTLEPGTIIRPQMTKKTARSLVDRLYGLKVKSIKELNR